MEQKEFIDELASYGSAVWFGVATAVIVFIIEIVLRTKGIIFSKKEKKIEKAKKAGNMILAQRVSYRFSHDSNDERRYIAQYKYELNGRERTKQEISHGMKPPSSITLYVVGKNKVMSGYDKQNPLEVILYIIPLACAVLVMKMLGFQG